MKGYGMFEDLWPVVISIVGRGATDEEAEEYLRRLGRIYERKQKVLWLTHVTPFLHSNREHTKRFGTWLKEHRAEVDPYNKGVAFLTESAAFRFVLTTIFLIQPLGAPYKLVPTVEDAAKWLEQRAREENMRLPPGFAEKLPTLLTV